MATRANKTFSLPKKQLEDLKKLSDKTMIPQTRLVEKGIEMALKKFKGE